MTGKTVHSPDCKSGSNFTFCVVREFTRNTLLLALLILFGRRFRKTLEILNDICNDGSNNRNREPLLYFIRLKTVCTGFYFWSKLVASH